jgi:anion-transporting  ArsA/GET3 family ATPase
VTASELIRTPRVLVCCGSGGVGKTTIAAVLGLEAARQGRRVAVVTIDPAKRLADALGIGELTNEPRRVDCDAKGELWALMLDTERTFDSLVRRHARDDEQAQRILTNRFYRNIAGSLSGTQEYMAAEKLYELHHELDFDLVVVDTPPSRHALDFLDAPARLTRFIDHPLFRVVTAPGRTGLKVASVAAQAFTRTVGKVLGAQVLDDAIGFFAAFEGMEAGFKARARAVSDLLAAEGTEFVLVASPRAETVAEAMGLAERLAAAAKPVGALVVNRMHPPWFVRRPRGSSEFPALRRNFDDLAGVAAAEAAQVSPLIDAMGQDAVVLRVPLLAGDVHDLDALDRIAHTIFGDR